MPFARTLAVAVTAATACVGALVTSPAAEAASRPTVARLSSSSSPTAGGARLSLTGTGFTHVIAVSFGRSRGTALRVASSRSLSVVVPRHTAGQVDVRVVARSGTSATVKADGLTYVAPPSVTSLSTTSGSTAGGTRLVVGGTGFTSVQAVSFGSATGTAVQVVSTRELTATVPAHGAGAVPVRVRTAYGLSSVTSHTFTFVIPGQDPISNLAVIDTTETSDRLSWELPSTGAPSQLVVRRAAGSTPPASPTDGDEVPDVAPTDTAVTDTGLTAGTQYSYAVFAEDASGDVSPAADATATTATAPRPAAPDAQVSRLNPDGSGGCPTSPGLIGNEYQIGFGGALANPDSPGLRVIMMTSIVDYGPAGTSAPTTVLAYTDDVGWSGTTTTPGLAYIHYDLSNLTDGHEFGISAVSTDETNPGGVVGTSEPSIECHFWLDKTGPAVPTLVSSNLTPSKPIGQADKVVVSSSDVLPTTGRASGIDHFVWGLDDSSKIDNRVVPQFTGPTATATIRFTPLVWGSHELYVEAVDKAGNVSPYFIAMFYSYDPDG